MPPTAALAATALLSATGSVIGGLDAARAGRVAERVGRLDAAAARVATEDAIRRTREEGAEIASAIRARTVAGGLALEGSPLEVLAENQRRMAADIEALARGGAVQVRRSLTEGALARQAGRQRRTAGFLQAGTSLASAAFQLGRAGSFGAQGTPVAGTYFGEWAR